VPKRVNNLVTQFITLVLLKHEAIDMMCQLSWVRMSGAVLVLTQFSSCGLPNFRLLSPYSDSSDHEFVSMETKFLGPSPRVNYTDLATAAFRRS
jgi:hypothetical protein